MTFIWTKLIQSVIKKAVVLIVSIVTQPAVGNVLSGFGLSIDPTQLTVALFALLESFRIWLTHQKWTPKIFTTLL